MNPDNSCGYIPVVKLLAIKYFITILMDNKMKRLMADEKLSQDIGYARRNQFTAYVLEKFLCFPFMGREGETSQERFNNDRWVFEWKRQPHIRCWEADEMKKGQRRTYVRSRILLRAMLDVFNIYPQKLGTVVNYDDKKLAAHEHLWWYCRNEAERAHTVEVRKSYQTLCRERLKTFREKVWAAADGLDVEEEYPDADAEALPLLRWMWYHRLIGNRAKSQRKRKEGSGAGDLWWGMAQARRRELRRLEEEGERRREELRERREIFMAIGFLEVEGENGIFAERTETDLDLSGEAVFSISL
ncbi:hypothetical protein QBC41DRAFT_388144 [Cercophora samala]|uniref:Uncharacterized protein n=1 Tax=Cercophora samala TaxID=330535 RepID=A0AA39ZMW0_9PEZI|nr:hypothetical protein QBC41DRAFT_388144 [Cercophora samala]